MINAKDSNLLALLLRSPDRGEGWRTVSAVCWPLIEEFGEPELIEADKENMRVRLTDKGETVALFVL